MILFDNRNKGEAKFYYAAPKVVIDTIKNEDLPDGLKKEFRINNVAGGFYRETFSLHFTSKFPPFKFKFDDNDIENQNKNVFYAKLKPLKKLGCIISGLLEYKDHKWLFIAKFPRLSIPDNIKTIKDDLNYDDF